jgi:hypothetical protein
MVMRCSSWLPLCGLIALPALAQPVDLNGRVIERALQAGQSAERGVPVLNVSQSQAEPLATAGAVPALGAGPDSLPSARQTMLWARAQRLGVALGLGVEERASPLGPAAWHNNAGLPGASRHTGLLVGLAVDASQRTQLTWQTPLLNLNPNPNTKPQPGTGFDDTLMGQQARQMRMGLVFNTKKPYSDLRRGVRFELSGQTSLSVRPRGGRVGLSLQSQW